MPFSTGVFLYGFLPAVLVLYFATPNRWRAWTLTLVSYVFYGWWRPDFVILMWISTIVDYFAGRGVARAKEAGTGGKRFVLLSCCVNLGLLAYFKYANFGVDTLNAMLAAGGHEPMAWTEIVLPVGISFYTFQTLSYTIDVYRGHAEPVRRFRDFACYVSMFPQLVAGPIVRYSVVAEELRERTHTWSKAVVGTLVFQAGLAKKLLIADPLGVTADAGFSAESLGFVEAWTASLAYTFQLYFDFSGYSDMAIGLGLLFGFRFPINFDRPYISESITEFWRRWHITLSSFLRDYLYVPLGGNRKGSFRTYVNLSLTMLLGGLWHGAAWTFIAWGAYQGLWLVIERAAGKRPLYFALPRPFRIAITFVIVVFGWVLFRAESMASAGRIMGSMLGLSNLPNTSTVLAEWTPVQTVALITAAIVVWCFRTTQEHARSLQRWWVVAVTLLFLLSLVQLHRAEDVPFLYFQF